MKHIRRFEDNSEKEYVIVSFPTDRLAVYVKAKKNVKHKSSISEFPFQYYDNFNHDRFEIVLCTKKEAKFLLPKIENFHNIMTPTTYVFEIITKAEYDARIDAYKYNL